MLAAACGPVDDNAADCDKGAAGIPCIKRTNDENARIALDDGDFATAITLLEEEVAADPENYQRFTLLAAAYAGRAGISILGIATSNFSSGGGSLIDSVSAFLPTPQDIGDAAYAVAVTDVQSAVTRLSLIPAEFRTNTATEKYSSSAVLQLNLYQTVYSVMYLNKFAVSATTGQFDATKLATMTEADAEIVIANLAAVASAQAAGDPALQAKVSDALGKIQAAEGTSTKEKLAAYLATKNGAAAGASSGSASASGSDAGSGSSVPDAGP